MVGGERIEPVELLSSLARSRSDIAVGSFREFSVALTPACDKTTREGWKRISYRRISVLTFSVVLYSFPTCSKRRMFFLSFSSEHFREKTARPMFFFSSCLARDSYERTGTIFFSGERKTLSVSFFFDDCFLTKKLLKRVGWHEERGSAQWIDCIDLNRFNFNGNQEPDRLLFSLATERLLEYNWFDIS